jgi:hypothetical protein
VISSAELWLPVRRLLPLEGDAVGARIQQVDADRAVRRARRHEHALGEVRRGHAGLHAVETEASLLAAHTGLRVLRLVGTGLDECGREEGVPRRYARQQAALLRLGPELGDRERTHRERGQRGDRSQRPAHLFEKQTEPQKAAIAPAGGLGQRRSQQVRLGELRPDPAVESVRIARDLVPPLGRHLLLEDLARQALDRALFFAECEVHLDGGSRVSPCSGAIRDRPWR